ncbi:MAG: hypothetical protein RB191_21055, partial [Terriglobia bacterium]|nr:hypothetical protein [Terriglobia bacterium]
MAEPTVDLVRRAIQNMKTSADAAYFFDRLKSPAWIKPLLEVGMFTAPPEPKRQGDYIQLEPWPQSRYLARMAPEAPDEVAQVIASLPETENGRVLVDLADALVRMPPEKAITLLEPAIRWLERPYLLLVPDRLSKLVVRLAESSQLEGALSLTAALLRLEPGQVPSVDGVELDLPTRARALIDDFEYQRIVGEVLPALIPAGGLRTLDLLCDLLASAIQLSRFSESEETDFSYLWRKTIEPSDQNLSHEPRETLVDAVRDGSQTLVLAHPDLMEPLISRLDDRSAVFRRIALHVLRLEAPAASELVTRRLLDIELLYGIDFYHEYWLILHDRFHDLTVDERATLFELIALGPTVYREGEFSEAERTLRIEVWQWRVLAAIKDELPPEWAERYHILTAERGEPEHPDLLSYTSSGW